MRRRIAVLAQGWLQSPGLPLVSNRRCATGANSSSREILGAGLGGCRDYPEMGTRTQPSPYLACMRVDCCGPRLKSPQSKRPGLVSHNRQPATRVSCSSRRGGETLRQCSYMCIYISSHRCHGSSQLILRRMLRGLHHPAAMKRPKSGGSGLATMTAL